MIKLIRPTYNITQCSRCSIYYWNWNYYTQGSNEPLV